MVLNNNNNNNMGFKDRQNHTTENESPRKTPFLMLGPMFSEHFSRGPHLASNKNQESKYTVLAYLNTACPHDRYQN
jgi:hypothetical protein